MPKTLRVNRPSRSWPIEIDRKYEGIMQSFKSRYPKYYNKIIDSLTLSPDVVVRGRIFPLRGEQYRGAWEYKEELPEGTFRLYYKLDITHHKVIIYYVGPKPSRAPLPPSDPMP